MPPNAQQLYQQLQTMNLGQTSDDQFRQMGFARGRQDAIDFLDQMKKQDPVHVARQQEQQRLALQNEARTAEQDFLGRFQTEFPTILSGIEEKLNLPGLRQQTQSAGSVLRGETQRMEDLPDVMSQRTTGFDVTQSQLEQMIAAEALKNRPMLRDATRAFEASASAQQFAESDFGRQAGIALQPMMTELDLMRDRFSREATGFGQAAERELSAIISQINAGVQLNQQQLQHAIQLAGLEEAKRQYEQSFTTLNLGDRQVLLDPRGNVVQSFPMGQLSGSGGFTFPQAPTEPPGRQSTGYTPILDSLWQNL